MKPEKVRWKYSKEVDMAAFFCAHCGAANVTDATLCFACGQDLQAAQAVADMNEGAETLLHGRYRLLCQIGTGGFGAVYKAEDTQNNNHLVAIKEIKLDGLKPQEMIEATDTFNREVRMLTSLSHPHLPRVHEHFSDPHHWYLVMDFINGETLEDYLERRQRRPHTSATLPLQEVLALGSQLCTVLDYLHGQGIIFRDLKPSNVMRAYNGQLYLIDFGIARSFKPGQAKDTLVLGSPGYAAPEQYGKAQTTPQSDIYSLGALLYHLLTGHDPSETPMQFAPLRSFDATLPQALEDLLTCMLAMKYDERPADIRTVRGELQRIAIRETRAISNITPPVTPQPAPRAAVPPPATPSAAAKIFKFIGVAFVVILVVAPLAICGYMALAWSHTGYYFGHHPNVETSSASLAAQQVYRSSLVSPTGDVSTLDPARAEDAPSLVVANMLFSGLVELDDNGSPQSQMASWDVSQDHLQWTFHLYGSQKFSDGVSLTSHDVAYSINRALQPGIATPTSLRHLGSLKDASEFNAGQIPTLIGDSILTPNDSTVILITSQPEANFLASLAHASAYVVEQSLIDKYGQQFTDHLTEGGTDGIFKLTNYIHGKELDFVPNPMYSLTSTLYSHLKQVHILLFKDDAASYQAYLTNQVDITDVPLSVINSSKNENSGGRFNIVWHHKIHYYTMNYLTKPFDNIHIRQAFAQALNANMSTGENRSEMQVPLYQVNVVPFYGGLYSSGAIPPGATTLLDEGMHEEGISSVAQLPPITLTYAKDQLDAGIEIAAVQQILHNTLDIDVKANGVASKDELQKEIAQTANNAQGLQMWVTEIALDANPAIWMNKLFGPNNAMNYGQNQSATVAQQQAVQQQLVAASNNFDDSKRGDTYRQVEQQLIGDVAWIPVYGTAEPVLLKTYVNARNRNTTSPEEIVPPGDWADMWIGAH